MNPDPKTAHIKIDLRGPSPGADCLDGIVGFPVAIEQMRSTGDDHALPQDMITATRLAFESLDRLGGEGLLVVAAAAQDLLYRHIMDLTILDRFTRAYCSLTIRYFFEQLSKQRVRTFYILDNLLRDDRLACTVELFQLSGIVVTTPAHGNSWDGLASNLRAGLDYVGHVAYIEPDASVNHLNAALELARGLACVATFRNRAPNEPEQEIITLTGS